MFPLVLVLALSAAPTFEVQPLDGPRVAGRLVGLDDKQVTLETPAGRASLDIQKVASIAAAQKPAPLAAKVWIDLVEGSTLAAEEYTVHDGGARIALAGGDVLELPVREVAVVRLQNGPEPMAAQWARILNLKLQSDVLVVAKADSTDYHKGVLHDVTEKQVRFELDGESLDVKRSKVYGLIYYHAAGQPPHEEACAVTDAGGSRWSARSLRFSDDKWEWTTAGGRTMRRAADAVVAVDLSQGKIICLSDLKPDSATYTPYFGMEKELPARLEFFRPRQDQNMESKPLKIGGKTYPKGLWLHSRTEMVYTLPGRFSRFEAVAGIDDEVRPRGHVHLLIRGDDKVLVDTALRGTDKDQDKPNLITADLSGVRRLVILADYGDDLDVAGHLDLGNARLIK
ncbi:MAG: NPCBM/NEW2 domain-containing protein [Thermoguttaceae bacterium]|jgi:hypothetical protein